jgi:hypothetical protein
LEGGRYQTRIDKINEAASLRAATLSPTNQPRTGTPFYRFVTNS